MLKYLIVLLDDTSVSYCQYSNKKTQNKSIPTDILRKGLQFAMKENLDVQFVYPPTPLTVEYGSLLESVEHTNIKPAGCAENAQVIVYDDCADFVKADLYKHIAYVLRTNLQTLISYGTTICNTLAKVNRLNIILTDIETFTDVDFNAYQHLLESLCDSLYELYAKGIFTQLNLISDRMVLGKMNNCGAAVNNITLAPNGKFYICPAYYYDNPDDCIGNLHQGVKIKNARLYKLEYAPICSHCDAYQCRRCIWQNQQMTLEVNTPSKEQCVTAHLERNASKRLLDRLHRQNLFTQIATIKEIDYLDPFEKRNEWE